MSAHVPMRSWAVGYSEACYWTRYATPCGLEVDSLGAADDDLCAVCLKWLGGRRNDFLESLEDPRWLQQLEAKRKRPRRSDPWPERKQQPYVELDSKRYDPHPAVVAHGTLMPVCGHEVLPLPGQDYQEDFVASWLAREDELLAASGY